MASICIVGTGASAAADPPASAKPAAKTEAKVEAKLEPKAKAEAKVESPAEAKPVAKDGSLITSKKLSVQELRDALSGLKNTPKTVVVRPAEDKNAAPSGQDEQKAKLARLDKVAIVKPHAYARERAAALSGHSFVAHGKTSGAAHEAGHWSYEGELGPQSWAKLAPENVSCASGRRQSPIHIEDDATLVGPAEALGFNYVPSDGSVVNNGHTIQVDLQGENVLIVRGVQYKLVQFHAHHPAEERINQKGFAMVMHLVHRSSEGKLAVVAVLLDPGQANPLIQKVWTHMPLDAMDRVKLPKGSVDLNELLPADRRYFQFMGSLTTPPCSEGVLWIVMKQTVSLSREQLRLFAKIFPNNARPIQPLHGRIVRNAE